MISPDHLIGIARVVVSERASSGRMRAHGTWRRRARWNTDPAVSEPLEWRGFRDPRGRRRRWEADGYIGKLDSLLVVALPAGAPR
jgi:hypothetical protein